MTLSATDIANEIVKWHKDKSRRKWQRKALHTLTKSSAISTDELELIADLAVSEFDSTGNQLPNDDPLNTALLGASSGSLETFRLLAMKHISGVNALKQEQEIRFTEEGLTVVYGHTGSGKSSYVRALKVLAISHGSHSAIESNIYESNDKSKLVSLETKIDGVEPVEPKTYDLDSEDNQRIGEIHIFDSDTNVVSVNKQNAVHFEPYGVKFLFALSDVYDRVKKSLQSRLEITSNNQLEIPINDSSGPMARSLTRVPSEIDVELIEQLAKLSSEEQSRYAQLFVEFGPYSDNDRAERLANVKAQIQRLSEFADESKKLSLLAGDDEIEIFETGHSNLRKIKRQATSSSIPNDVDLPLDHTLSDEWMNLWASAEAYSTNHAYPGQEFPQLLNALCVLCMQPLQTEAIKRLSGLNLAVQELANAAYSVAFTNYTDKIEHLVKRSELLSIPATFSADLGGNSDELRKIATYSKALRTRIESLPTSPESKWGVIDKLPDDPTKTIETRISSLNIQREAIEQAGDSDNQSDLKREYEELRLREWTSKNIPALTAHFQSKILENNIVEALATTTTTGIANQITKLTKSLVEEPLIANFTDNLRQLGLTELHVESTTSGRKGELVQNIRLSESPRTTVSDVASEGEFRVVGLATFLSEAAIAGNCHTVIFDDPARSLDQQFRRRIARRLVKETRERQVIIFTHDIAFVHRLIFECSDASVDIEINSLDTRDIEKGIVRNEIPWELQKTTVRINRHKDFVQNFNNRHGNQLESVKTKIIKAEFNLLRETWERATEEVLLNGAIERHGINIATQRLSVIDDVTPSDLDELDKGVSRCSEMMSGHASSNLLSDDPPTIEELDIEVIRIDKWRKQIVSRRN